MYGSNCLFLWAGRGGPDSADSGLCVFVVGGSGRGEGQHSLEIFVKPHFPMEGLKPCLSPEPFPFPVFTAVGKVTDGEVKSSSSLQF